MQKGGSGGRDVEVEAILVHEKKPVKSPWDISALVTCLCCHNRDDVKNQFTGRCVVVKY